MTIETSRLTLRPLSHVDHQALHAVFTQPGVRQFIFDDEVISPTRTSEIIQKSADLFAQRRFGLWAARLHSRADAASGEQSALLIGFGGLWYFRDRPQLELLFGVADAHRKQGYGREIARAVLDYAFTELNMRIVRASTDAANDASRDLLLAIGARFERQEVVNGLDTAFYSLRS